MKQIAILVASLGKNVELANKLQELLKEQGGEAFIINLAELKLPLYTTAEAEENGLPQKVKELADKLLKINKFIFVAPEYNGTIPPAMNNTIAWLSTIGDDWRELFNGKAAVIATHSGGGGMHVLMAMRQQLSYIGMNVLGRQLCTNFQKHLSEKSANAVIENLLSIN